MTKVSASTLARQAAKTKDKAEAKRLRARAAKLRREQRAADAAGLAITEAQRKPRPMKGLPDREAIIKRVNKRIDDGKHSGIVVGLDPRFMQPDEAANDSNAAVDHADLRGAQAILSQARAASVDSMPLTERPGHGEIVGGYLSRKAEEITKIARKKGGIDGVQMMLRGVQITAQTEAVHDARQSERKAVQAAREEMRDKSLCGFIAMFEASLSTGTVPPACIMSADVLHNIVDALKANGYRADGKR